MNHSQTSHFDNQLEDWIISAVQSGVQDFWQLVSTLPGVYPTMAREAVGRLVTDSRIPASVSVESQAARSVSDFELEVPGLPPPHPLSADWRFTRKTAAFLLERVVSSTEPSNAVALIGVPSVFFLAGLEKAPRRFVLLDENPLLADRVPIDSISMEFRHCDVKKEMVDAPLAQTVLADPPWYEDDVLGFLRIAARLCADGGMVFLGFGSNGTRPGISEERQRIIDKADKLGLVFTGIESLSLSYATPFFEHNALRAARFKHIPTAWRRGDLLLFRRHGSIPPTQETRTADECSWAEAHIRGIEVRVRGNDPRKFADPRLIPLIPGDILPTVSRRDNLYKAADVWTTGNRIYRCEGRNILSMALKALGENSDLGESIQRGLASPVGSLRISVGSGSNHPS